MRRTLTIVFQRNGIVRRGLTGFVVSLFISTIFVLVMDARRHMARLATASSDGVQWALNQTETEFQTLEIAVLNYQAGHTQTLDQIRLRYDVAYSRAQTLKRSGIFEELRQLPSASTAFAEVLSFLDDWTPVIDGPDAELAARVSELGDAARASRFAARRISLAGIEHFSRVSDRRRMSVSETLFNIAVLTVALVALLLLVVLALFRLARARDIDATENRQIRERMETILSTSLDAVVVTNRNGRIIEYNGAAERVFGYTHAEAIGADMASLIIPDHFRDAHQKGMHRYLENGSARVIGNGIVQLQAMRKDGKIFPVDVSLASAQSPTGEIFIGFMRDISARVRSEENLRTARDRAIAGEKQKAELLAVMSHEMRTPLNGILGTLELMDFDRLDARQRHYLRIVRNSGQLLLSHVNNVLDISRLDAGKMRLSKTRFDLVELLEEVIESQQGQAASNGNSLVLSPPNPALHDVYSDPDRIRQVLLNLVGNAIKFTQNGTITLEAECQNGLDEVEIRVIDTGVGISETDLERIFDDFETVDASYGRQTSGTGLGLGISDRLASALGGTLGAESEPGDGSLFWMRLPLSVPKDTPAVLPKMDSGQPEPPKLAARNILIVEDNAVNRMVARQLLERDGHQVTEARDGAEGVECASKNAFDAILMDISMPGMDGMTATRLIRDAGGPCAAIPIIAATAHALPDEIAAFRAAGMTDVLIKPLSARSIRQTLLRIFEPDAPAITLAMPSAFPILDQAHLTDISRDLNPDALRAALSIFRSEMQSFLDRPLPVPPEPLGAITAEAHRMAGSAGVFGARALTEALRRFQHEAEDAAPQALATSWAELTQLWRDTKMALDQSGIAEFSDEDQPT